jgi:hypothetical protein
MNGHVFQCHSETSDAKQFSVSLEKLQHYVFKHFKNPTDIGGIFKELKIPEVPRPTKPVFPLNKDDPMEASDHEINLSIFAEDVKDYVKRRNTLHENVKKLYSVIWGQCSMPMRAKLGAAQDFDIIEDKKNSARLLREVKGISYEYDGHRNPYLSLDDAKTKYYKYYQKENETNVSHFNTFCALAEVVEHHGGDIGRDDALVNLEVKKVLPGEDIDTVGSEKLALFRTISRSKALAIDFIKTSNWTRYGALIDDLENQYSRGTDQYPSDLPKALNTIDCYVRGRTNPHNMRRPPSLAENQEI